MKKINLMRMRAGAALGDRPEPVYKDIWPPTFDNMDGNLKHLFEFYVFGVVVTMVFLFTFDAIVSRIPGLGTASFFLFVGAVLQTQFYQSYKGREKDIVLGLQRVKITARFPAGKKQVFDENNIEFFGNSTLAVETEYGIIDHYPIQTSNEELAHITDNKMLYELPGTMSVQQIIDKVAEISTTDGLGFYIYHVKIDRFMFYQDIGLGGENASDASGNTKFCEMVWYAKHEWSQFMNFQRGEAFGAGWSFKHSATASVSLDYKLTCLGDVPIFQVFEIGDDEPLKPTNDEAVKLVVVAQQHFYNRQSAVMEGIQYYMAQESDHKTMTDLEAGGKKALVDSAYRNAHPASEDLETIKDGVANKDKKAKKDFKEVAWALAIVLIATIVGIIVYFAK